MAHCFSILDVLENPENQEIFKTFASRKFAEQQIISDENTVENNVFIVLVGEVRVYISFEGREFTLFRLGTGDVFTTHSKMIVEAKTASEILVTSLKSFEQALLTFPELSVSIIASMGRGLANAVRIIEGLMFHDVKHRLINFLLDIAGERGRKVDGGVAITMDYSTEEIATLIGSTRQSTSILFSELIKDGYITKVNRKLIIIHDLKRLGAMLEPIAVSPN